MESTRQKKVSRLVQKELSTIFQKIGPELLTNVIISVTIVRVSIDLSYAKIFLSIFPVKEPEIALRKIIDNKVNIRKKLGARIKNQLRIVPDLQFYLDDSASYAEEIDKLLKK